MQVCILGLGYIGLPTASILANNGFEVHGVDVNPSVVETINRGFIHIKEPGLRALVGAAIGSGNLRAATVPTEAEAFIIAVPTPLGPRRTADMTFVENAARSIVPFLRPGNLVILESTSPPMTTTNLVAPILAESGLEIGEEVLLAHCPERVLPGRILKELIENDRIIGGVNRKSAEAAERLYRSFVSGNIHLTDATTAEMVKLMENTFRDVNIALANELARMAEESGINAWEVIRLANLHPRVNLHLPGPGVGGHCISVDPWFLVEKFPDTARLIRTARELNSGVPQVVADRILEMLADVARPRVTILGLAYKGNVDDVRESPAIEVVELLGARGVEVRAYDPHVREWHGELHSLETAFQGSDLAVLLTDHAEFRHLNPGSLGKLMRHRRLLDTRAALDLESWAAAGFETGVLGARPAAGSEAMPAADSAATSPLLAA